MMTHEQKTRLGIFLLVATIIFLAALGFFLVPKLLEQGDTYYINFRNTSVYGLDVASIVTYQGMDIGKVTRMEVNPKVLDSVLVYIKIRKGFPIKKDTTAVLMYAGITGLKFVDLRNGTPDAEPVRPGGEIQTAAGIEEIAGNIVNNVQTAINRFNSLLSDQNREQITRFLESLDKSAQSVAAILQGKRGQIERSLDNAEKVTTDLAAAAANLRQVSTDVQALVQRVRPSVEAAADNAARLLSDDRAGRTVQDLNALIAKGVDTLKGIDKLVQTNDSQLAQALTELRQSMENLTQFTRELLEDPTILIRSRKEKQK